MNQLDVLYQLERLLASPQPMGRDALMSKLEVSRATLKRYLEILRNRMNVPIEYDRCTNTYAIQRNVGASGFALDRQELPGVWFSQQELIALLTMSKLIGELDATGMLHRQLRPILERLDKMLGCTPMQSQEFQRRVRILGVARREVSNQFFERVGLGLTQRNQLHVRYFTRSRGVETSRILSPQRLVHHRHTWFLDAWCHASCSLKRFALDAFREVQVLKDAAHNVPVSEVEKAFDVGYGIYHGDRIRWATLVFTARASAWVALEQWHPDQKARRLASGSLELKVPYTNDEELLMDIQRHGADVKVKAPAALRNKLLNGLKQAVTQYENGE
ncbi:MAG: WYL domain-containing transcriptional regulator [Rhodoferax sp.]|nr:WYL domain-containing transcriptional regulator [Rhodoferax sp.]